jgi:hypothetical protein
MDPLVLELPLPEYSIDSQPDYVAIGIKIDRIIEENFAGKDVAIRAISSMDHPQLVLDSLAEIVLETGTDKYDPNRKGVAHEEFEPYRADFQAGSCTVGKDSAGEGADIIKKFYENVLLDRGYRLRIDLIIIYDLHQIVRAEKVDEEKPGVDARLEPYLFRFKDPERKTRALLGIIKLT